MSLPSETTVQLVMYETAKGCFTKRRPDFKDKSTISTDSAERLGVLVRTSLKSVRWKGIDRRRKLIWERDRLRKTKSYSKYQWIIIYEFLSRITILLYDFFLINFLNKDYNIIINWKFYIILSFDFQIFKISESKIQLHQT